MRREPTRRAAITSQDVKIEGERTGRASRSPYLQHFLRSPAHRHSCVHKAYLLALVPPHQARYLLSESHVALQIAEASRDTAWRGPVQHRRLWGAGGLSRSPGNLSAASVGPRQLPVEWHVVCGRRMQGMGLRAGSSARPRGPLRWATTTIGGPNRAASAV